MSGDVFYHGCIGESGHFLWVSDVRYARSSDLPSDWPKEFGSGYMPGAALDATYCPKAPKGTYVEPQGLAALHHVGGWTVLAAWDRTVDSRGRSNSVFVVRGEHNFGETCRLAAKAFPAVWARMGHIIHLA